MIASPGIIVGLTNHEQMLSLTDFTGHFLIGVSNLLEHGCPVGTCVRPSQLHAPLWLPFCRQAPP